MECCIYSAPRIMGGEGGGERRERNENPGEVMSGKSIEVGKSGLFQAFI